MPYKISYEIDRYEVHLYVKANGHDLGGNNFFYNEEEAVNFAKNYEKEHPDWTAVVFKRERARIQEAPKPKSRPDPMTRLYNTPCPRCGETRLRQKQTGDWWPEFPEYYIGCDNCGFDLYEQKSTDCGDNLWSFFWWLDHPAER